MLSTKIESIHENSKIKDKKISYFFDFKKSSQSKVQKRLKPE